MSNKEYKQTQQHINNRKMMGLGKYVRTKEITEKCKKTRGNYKHSEQTKLKISLAHKGKKKPPFTEEHKQKMKLSKQKTYQRILQEVPELEKQGFKCIPITKVIPDIIAIKNNKIYAVEVEYGRPNYNKYTDDIRKYFDDIWWVIRKPK